MKDGPIKVGEVAEQTVGLIYHKQVMDLYQQASEQITLNALVMLCLTARRYDHTVMYVLLDDSDQGNWQTVAGLAANLPQYAGHYSTELDRDRDDEFEDEGWASSIDDRTEDVWQVFTVTSEFLPTLKLLDVERVLNEIDLPWRPVSAEGRAFREQGFCGHPTDWPDKPCGLLPQHPGQHYPKATL